MPVPSAPFVATNENLPGILAGMCIQPQDKVLAVCGSGDQPLAMIAQGARVLAVDNDPEQIALVRYRLDQLQSDDYAGFVEGPRYSYALGISDRAEFFCEERLRQVQANLGNLTLVEADVLHLGPELLLPGFDKIYLSNALSCGNLYTVEDRAVRRNALASVARSVPIGGSIYTTLDEGDIFTQAAYLRRDEARSFEVRRLHERAPFPWRPSVYTKIAEP